MLRLPIPIPFPEAGGPANVYVIEEDGGGLALFDCGIGTPETMNRTFRRRLNTTPGENREHFRTT